MGRGEFGWTHAPAICAGSGLPPFGVFAWAHWESDGAREFYDNSLERVMYQDVTVIMRFYGDYEPIWAGKWVFFRALTRSVPVLEVAKRSVWAMYVVTYHVDFF